MTSLARKTDFCDNADAETLAHQQARSEKDEPLQVNHEIAAVSALDTIEAMMLAAPQIEISVSHHFGPGIYIRSGFMPAGVQAIGHAHKKPHMNMLAQGKLAIACDGIVRVIEAPYLFASDGGRKLVYVMEDAVLMNIYATDETDIDVIEETFVDKSDAWRDAHQRAMNMRAIDAAVQQTLRGKI
jgi:hypothetical protein